MGQAGAGKIAPRFAWHSVLLQEVPFELADMHILELDMMSVVAGTRFRGDF